MTARLSGEFNFWKHIVISSLLDALRSGLSRFSGPSRVALLLQFQPGTPVVVYDSQDLLRGHEKYFLEYYAQEERAWRDGTAGPSPFGGQLIEHSAYVVPRADVPLSFYARLFADDHSPASVSGPTQRWLAEAARVLFQELIRLANGESVTDFTFARAIDGYAPYAVADFIRKLLVRIPGSPRPQRGWEDQIIRCVTGVSMGVEEGHAARGRLAFLASTPPDDTFMVAQFSPDQMPTLGSHKHIRKLLRVTDGFERALVAQDTRIVGIASGPLPDAAVVADFRGRRGEIRVGSATVCTFSQGQFYSFTLAPDLHLLAGALRSHAWKGRPTRRLLRVVDRIARASIDRSHGCTIVLDPRPSAPVAISGHKLEEPLDLSFEEHVEIAIGMAGVDGALYVRGDACLCAFGCILDGKSAGGEDLSRGARYNSALRFCQSNSNVIVITVSEDGPVSVFGLEPSFAQAPVVKQAHSLIDPPTIDEWAYASKTP